MDLLNMSENVSCAQEARAMYVSEKESGIENYDTQFIYQSARNSRPDRRRECLYLIAIAHTKLCDYEKALQCCKSLIEVNPEDHQAVELKEEIERRTRRDGLTGLALIGGAALGVIGAITAVALASRHSR
nr:unnamed protein product [Spirometra erinaceieuropaei]